MKKEYINPEISVVNLKINGTLMVVTSPLGNRTVEGADYAPGMDLEEDEDDDY